MTVNLYNINTAPDHLRQNVPVTPAATYTGTARAPVSVDGPYVLIQAQITTGNYVYIPEFSRYYYITDRDIIRDDLTGLQLKSDPLTSFASLIDNLPVYARRTSKRAETTDTTAGYNADIPDNQTVCEQGTRCRNIFIASMPIQANAIYLVAVG